MKDPVHLANCLKGGLIRLHEAGIDVNGLFQSSVGRNHNARTDAPSTMSRRSASALRSGGATAE
jgi:hypothetical protein